MSANSSGSVERFMLGASEFKDFEVLPPGATAWTIELSGEVVQTSDGDISGATATVKLQTKEALADAWVDVVSTPIVAGGNAVMSGSCRQFSRIINSAGEAMVVVVAKPTHRVQPVASL